MIFTIKQLKQLSDVATQAVKLAASYIKQVDNSQLKTHYKHAGSSLSAQVVTDVDMHCQEIIIKQLRASCNKYDIALLSEENCTDIAINQHPRLTKETYWCIDPLDGTLPFIEGRKGYAVSVALVSRCGVPILAAIALPASDNIYHIEFDDLGDPSVYKNAIAVNPNLTKPNKNLTFYCDQSFINQTQYPTLIKQLTLLLDKLNLQQLTVISEHGAVVNALLVLENDPACYIKLPKTQQGGGALWDFSGTACITQMIGAWVSDIDGLPLALNQADSYYMNKKGIIYASNTILAQEIMKLFD